jgi:outer membrane receptor protein involved in Fe transport
MWGVDLVWKWAQNGDPSKRHFKFQAEYMHRDEDGTLTYDTGGTSTPGTGTDTYKSKQSGWYAQAVYQFIPRWRAGLRYEELDYGTVSNALAINGVNGLTAADFPLIAENDPKRTTAMMDFSPSEFSRFRLQFSRDEARFSESDNQVFLQYIMSLGAHGGHKF